MPARSVALGLSEPWWEGVTLAKPLGPQGLPCPAPSVSLGLLCPLELGATGPALPGHSPRGPVTPAQAVP